MHLNNKTVRESRQFAYFLRGKWDLGASG